MTELLPGLQYAVLETRRVQRGDKLHPDDLLEHHFTQFACSASSRPSSHGKELTDKCDPSAFSRLRSYLSSPVKFAVPLVNMSNVLKEDIPLSGDSEKCSKNLVVKDSNDSKIVSAASKMKGGGDKVLNENKKQPAKKRTFKRRRGGRKGRKKPTQQATLPASPTVEKQVPNKKRKLNGGEEQEQAVSSNRMTLKLASVPNTHRRKRGVCIFRLRFFSW